MDEVLRRFDESDFIGLHAADLCSRKPGYAISIDSLPSSWQGGLPHLRQLRYTVWSQAIASSCKEAKPSTSLAIWCPRNFPDPEAPPITLLPPKDEDEECLPDDMHVFYPSVVAALGKRGLTLPQFKISHTGNNILSVTIENKTSPVLVAADRPQAVFIDAESSPINVLPNEPITLGVFHNGKPMPLFSLYTAVLIPDESVPNAESSPFRIFAMRIEEPLLNLLARPVESNSDYI